MSSPPSDSEQASASFDLLEPRIQRWVWSKGWRELRPVQEKATPPVLEGRDVLLAAPTAGGKTEAAFLPIASKLGAERDTGLGCLCVSPLKALINDQFRRLEELFEAVDLPVHRWHGDISQGRKKRALRNPRGVLLITPESLEALFARRGGDMLRVCPALRFVVVDELHAFIGTERGRQLQSLLARVEDAAGRRIPRIGLSATLGDMGLAAEFLRPRAGAEVERVEDHDNEAELRAQVRGCVRTAPAVPPREVATASEQGCELDPEDVVKGDVVEIANHLFKVLRGSNNLVFANSRAKVEIFSDLLRRRCEREQLPVEFFPHHGSLSRELREDAEEILKRGDRPATLIATTTLELGIDVGDVASVAQVGVPPSVASLRQRLGRSGRRGDAPAVLRSYVSEDELRADSPAQDVLRAQLVQTVAMLELLLEGWCEPPDPHQLHLSTLVQQVLSLVAQMGGVTAKGAYRLLCADGPFGAVMGEQFAALLRGLADHELIDQADDGDLVLGVEGEKLVDHYTFYAAFQSPDEYRLVTKGGELGSLPIAFPLFEGMLIIFAGRRWRVLRVDVDSKTLLLEPAAGGTVPMFDGGAGLVHDRIRQRMRELYTSDEVPRYLNRGGQQLLREGQDGFERLGLRDSQLLKSGRDVLLFPWAGDRVMNTLFVWLSKSGFDAELEGITLGISGASIESVRASLAALCEEEGLSARGLAAHVRNTSEEKYDHLLPRDLAEANYGHRALNVEGALRVANGVLGR